MQHVDFGTKVKAIEVGRTQCAENVAGRAIVLDPSPAVKQCAWLEGVNAKGEPVKRSVELNQDEAIRFRATPRVNYYMLIARLNTDMNGNVVGDDIVVEYLQMSAKVYDDFIEACESIGNYTTIKLKKEVRKPGDTYGYVKPIPANNVQVSPEVLAKVEKMRNTPQFLESLWFMVDSATSITVAAWQELIGKPVVPQQQQGILPGASYQQPQGIPAQPVPQPAQHFAPKPAPSVSHNQPSAPTQPNDFGGDDFAGGGFDDDFNGNDFA